MADPVNLSTPGLPYLLFALGFFAVVSLLVIILTPIEIVARRARRQHQSEIGDTSCEQPDGDSEPPPTSSESRTASDEQPAARSEQ